MESDDFLTAFTRECAALAAAARLGLDARVPSCPDWDVAKLLQHTGLLSKLWTAQVHAATTERTSPQREAMPDGDARVAWFEEAAAELASALKGAGEDAPCWNFTGENMTVGWVTRRVAHELAVHRWDGELAHGDPDPIDAALAADGIDERLRILLPLQVSRSAPEATLCGTLHIHCTDVAGEWIVEVDAGKVAVRAEHAKGDAAVRGMASDLLLFTWGRSTEVEVIGDASVVERWKALPA